LSGFEYHGPKGRIGFAPKITPDDFRAAFTCAQGWGTFAQKREGKTQTDSLEMRWGTLDISTLSFVLPDGSQPVKVDAKLSGREVKASHDFGDRRLTVTMPQAITISEGEKLEVSIQVN
jgi:hypothetical protein